MSISVAELKRRLTLGTRLTLVRAPWLPEGQEIQRTVVVARATAIAMQPANLRKPDEHSWLYWKGVQAEETAGGFKIKWRDDPHASEFEYRWDQAAA